MKLTSPEPKYRFLTDVNSKSQCPIHKLGLRPQRILFIPVKDKMGVTQNKFLRVVEGGSIHKLIIENGGDIPNCHVVVE